MNKLFGILLIFVALYLLAYITQAWALTQEVTMTAEVPLWYEISTSTGTVFIKTNGNVKVSNPSNNYAN